MRRPGRYLPSISDLMNQLIGDRLNCWRDCSDNLWWVGMADIQRKMNPSIKEVDEMKDENPSDLPVSRHGAIFLSSMLRLEFEDPDNHPVLQG